MSKLVFLATILAVALAAPEANPAPAPKAKPGILSAPLVAAPAVAYTSAYSAYPAPLAYSAYVSPSVYTAGYRAYPAYSAPLVVV